MKQTKTIFVPEDLAKVIQHSTISNHTFKHIQPTSSHNLQPKNEDLPARASRRAVAPRCTEMHRDAPRCAEAHQVPDPGLRSAGAAASVAAEGSAAPAGPTAGSWAGAMAWHGTVVGCQDSLKDGNMVETRKQIMWKQIMWQHIRNMSHF